VSEREEWEFQATRLAFCHERKGRASMREESAGKARQEAALVLCVVVGAALATLVTPASLEGRSFAFFVGTLIECALPFYLGRVAFRSSRMVFFLCLLAVLIAIPLGSTLLVPRFWLRPGTQLPVYLLLVEFLAFAFYFLGREYQRTVSAHVPVAQSPDEPSRAGYDGDSGSGPGG
jgi:hypothetical protein